MLAGVLTSGPKLARDELAIPPAPRAAWMRRSTLWRTSKVTDNAAAKRFGHLAATGDQALGAQVWGIDVRDGICVASLDFVRNLGITYP